MATQRGRSAGSQHVPPWAIFGSTVLMGGIWILLVGGVHRDEMIVGALCLIGAILMLLLVAGVRQQNVRFTVRDIFSGWRLPWYAVQDTYLVSKVLVHDLLLGRKPGSSYRVCGFRTSKRNPGDVARRVLITSFASATPNVIIIGVDYAQNRLLFHQLQQGELNQMMRQLGAQP